METKEQAIAILKEAGIKFIDLVIIPELEAAAKKSATPIDDIVLAALKEPFKQALKEYIEKA